MRKHIFPGLAALLCAVGTTTTAWAGETKAQSPELPDKVTFTKHIAPIIFANCTSCHRPGEAAPFKLMAYRDVQKRGRTILDVVQRRYMPPWQPEPGHGEFRNERRLSDQQIALLRRWVRTGMAEGDPHKLPPLPKFQEGWYLGKPDLVVTMDRAFEVPASGPDIYRNFVLRLDLPEDKWLTAIELRPSARAVVHHALYFSDNNRSARKLDGQDGQPGFEGMGFRGSGLIGAWAVGGTPEQLPDGLAMPLARGADLVVQTHFHPSGKVEQEQLTVGLYFAKQAPTRTLVTVSLPPAFGLFAGIDIPPGKAVYTVTDSFTLPTNVELVGCGAHAHYIGKSLRSWAVLPDGTTQRLFWIKDWDFNWQGSYTYKQRVRLPKGTVLHAEVIWDNSADNDRNPNQPPKRIKWGESTDDEMGSVRFLVVASEEKDVPVLKSSVRDHMRRAMLESIRRGDKIDLKQFGLDGAPAKQGPAYPPPATATDLDGKQVQPLQAGTAKASVLFFLAPDCPISNSYAPEINALVKDNADRPLRFYAVYADPELSAEAARKHAADFGYRCPVLLDQRHQLVAATGVTTTPEVAVVTADGRVAYRGRIDDRYPQLGVHRQAPTRRDLRAALSAVLADQPVATPRTTAVGCSIPDLR
jgi:mono/diheme cytochrome c family protein/thiol-disulfide isomerase/thioredoxin